MRMMQWSVFCATIAEKRSENAHISFENANGSRVKERGIYKCIL